MTWLLLDCGHYALDTDGRFTPATGEEPAEVKCRVCSVQLYTVTDGSDVISRVVLQVES